MTSFLDEIVSSMNSKTPKPTQNPTKTTGKKPRTYILPAIKKQPPPTTIPSLPKENKKRSQDNTFDVLGGLESKSEIPNEKKDTKKAKQQQPQEKGNDTKIHVDVQQKKEEDKGVIITIEQCKQAIAEIKKSKVIAVDCEGVNLGREGRLCLIQV